jgi:hypothetical protein
MLRFDSILNAILDAVAAIRNGEMVVVGDDANRKNEGDLFALPSSPRLPRSTSWPPKAGA